MLDRASEFKSLSHCVHASFELSASCLHAPLGETSLLSIHGVELRDCGSGVRQGGICIYIWTLNSGDSKMTMMMEGMYDV